jgi:hypothetical protein
MDAVRGVSEVGSSPLSCRKVGEKMDDGAVRLVGAAAWQK